jgi:predicted permease
VTNWRRLVHEHAVDAGVELPPATVEELALHLEDIYSAARRDGASDADAHARAMVALKESGMSILRRHARRAVQRAPAERAEETARVAGGRSLLMFSALRTALRQFRHHPGFALTTVLVLGIGTAAATTVFTIVDSVVLRPLPYTAPDRLVTLWDTNFEKGLEHDPISPVNFMDYRALPVFDGAAAWWRPSINLIDPGLDPVRVNTIEVSGNLFDVLGVRPQLGEGFPVGGPFFLRNQPAIAISDRLWRTRYSADPSIVGRQLNLNGTPHTVLGIMPPKFTYPDDVDVWQRLSWDLTQHSRAAHFMEAVARVAPGVTIDQASSAVTALSLRLQKDFVATNKGWGTRVIPLLDQQLGYYRPALMVLFGAVGLLLTIGCLNVASLLLTRALSREREMSVRIAIGASPRQLATQLLAESLVLSAVGAAVGIALAVVLLPAIVALTPVTIPRLDEARVDLRALALGVTIMGTTTIFFGLLPTLLILKRGPSADLKSSERGSSRAARRVYSWLVASEVALACALLVSSVLLVRTVSRMMHTPTGVDADLVLTTTVQLPVGTYASWESVGDTHAAIVEQIRRQSGVEAVGAGNRLPLEVGWRMPFAILGDPAPARAEDATQAQYLSVSDGYFEALGAAIARGRSFSNLDIVDGRPVVVVNERFAQRYLSGRDAVGQTILTGVTGIGPLGANVTRRHLLGPPPADGSPRRNPPLTPFEIVGIVRDIRNAPLGQETEPAVYFSTRQFPFRELFLTVRTSDRGAGQAAIRNALKIEAPTVPLGLVQTWGERFGKRTAEPRLLMTILVVFGAIAALLAALGVYGLFSWSVALRTRELAIRLTLGAPPRSVGQLVLRQSAVLIVGGLIVGVLLVRIAERSLATVLYQISPTDPASTALAGALLLVAALVACIPPAVRAMRVDPAVGLRVE